MKRKLITASMVLLLLAPFIFSGCDFITGNTPAATTTASEGFAIYLTRDNIPPDKMEMQSHVEIAAAPVLSSADIVAYNWETQEIKLTIAAWERLQSMNVPTGGTSFVVCVDKAPVYWGAFWAGYSSQSFDGVTIMAPALGLEDNVIQLGLGYPSESFYQGEDPRPNLLIKAALEKAGKLN